MTRVDNILKSFNKMIKRLEDAIEFHLMQAYDFEQQADKYSLLSTAHEVEAKKATTIKTKIEGLITV